jgi:hypothetical protein
MERLDDTARRLLREMGYQAEGNPSEATDVAPREAAESLDLDPRAPEYTAALNHLLALGFIEPKNAGPGPDRAPLPTYETGPPQS